MDRDWTVSFSIRFRNGTCIILDKKYNIANSSCHFGSYGSIWTGPSPKKYYMYLRSFGPYNIFLVTDRSIYCHMTLSAMNYLLYSSSNFQGYCDTTSQIVLFTKHPRPARINKIYHPSGYLSINLKKINLNLVYFVVWLSYKKKRGGSLEEREIKRSISPLSDWQVFVQKQLCNVNALKLALC